MDTTVGRYEAKNKRFGAVLSAVVHVALLLFLLLSFLEFPDPPPGQEGILVNLGIPDMGQGNENSEPAPMDPVEDEAEEDTDPEEIIEETQEEITPPVEEEVIIDEEPEPDPVKEVVKTEDPEAIALKKREERIKSERAEAKRKQQVEENKRIAEEEARKRAEAEAKRKAAEEAARKKREADKMAEGIGGLFGPGKGKGNTGTPGSQGDPNGDPNSNVLVGKSTGSGTVGGGLDGRGVKARPKISDRTQKTGKVVVTVCVNAAGSVISAKYTQRGSTTTDSTLRSIAEKNAKKWKFEPGSVDKQCGTITFNFKVK